ncbi:MAG: DsbA family protein [Actinomycetota bacterium]|nr:DsbA family protein [Actinomycetota bacterium]
MIDVDLFTDPGCPWAYSAEPQRLRLRWLYGDAMRVTPRMVVLAERPEEYEERGFTTEVQAGALATIQERFGMPIDLGVRPRMAATAPACRAVVATRLHAPERADALLRRLRVRAMAGDLLDERATIAGAAREAGVDPDLLERWEGAPETEAALREDMHAARHPVPAALALDHKLAGWEGGRRYTCPSWVMTSDGTSEVAPGFQPLESYEVLVANLAPELERRADPESVEEVLAWAGEPLATAEVALLCGLGPEKARERLAAVADERRVGPEGFWTLPARPGQGA